MKYDITKSSVPSMPNLGRGTECIKLLLSQASKDMYEPLVPMLFPVLGAHISGTEFQYPDLSWKEPCGMMANLVAHSGDNKGQLSDLVEALCRDFRQHDRAELNKLLEWSKLKNSKAANKDKPVRPDVAFWFPPSDTTNPAFIQNAMALEMMGGRTQYFNLPEVEMADRLCGGHRQVSIQNRNLRGDGAAPRFRFPTGSMCGIYNLPVLNRLRQGEDLYITEGCSDCWAMLSAGHKAIAIPSATLLTKEVRNQLETCNLQLETHFHMYPDRDEPGERLFLQLKEVLPSLVHHQLPPGCKDFSEKYLKDPLNPPV